MFNPVPDDNRLKFDEIMTEKWIVILLLKFGFIKKAHISFLSDFFMCTQLRFGVEGATPRVINIIMSVLPGVSLLKCHMINHQCMGSNWDKKLGHFIQ